jgi:hypothetical protein
MANGKQNIKLTAWKASMKRNVCKVEQMNDSDNGALLIWKCLYQVRVITVFTVFRLLTDFVCLYNYEFGLSLCKIVRSSVILLLPLLVPLL